MIDNSFIDIAVNVFNINNLNLNVMSTKNVESAAVNANVNVNVNNETLVGQQIDEEVVNREVQVVEENESKENSSQFKSFQQVVKELLGAGNKLIKNIRVRSAIATKMDNYVRISLTLDTPVDGYISDEYGVYTRNKTNVIFASSFSLGSLLKESDETAWCANQLIENFKGFEVIIAGAKIDIIQEEVSADELYKNPFNKVNTEGTYLGHDSIINHVVKITLSKQANKMLEMMAMKMMMGSMSF